MTHPTPDLRALTRRQIFERAGAAGLLLTVPGLLAACGSGSGDERQADLDELTWALPTGIRALDIATSFDTTTMMVLVMLQDRLVSYDDSLELKPELAESWERTSPTSYVYKLREDAMFWDGTPVTADDVVASLQRHVDPEGGSQVNPYFLSVEKVEATAPFEVTVTLSGPDNFFQYAPVLAGILPKAFIDEHGDKIGTPRVLTMGSGPYEVKSFSPDKGATLVRNESYWGTKPAAKRIDLRVLAEEESRLLAVRSKEVQGSNNVPLDQARQWDSIPGTETTYAPGLTIQYLSFDLESEPWSDIHVRRAFAHAIDREGLINAALGGHGQAAHTVVPPGQWGDVLDADGVESLYESLPRYEFDLDRARAELAQSSRPDGFKVKLQVPADSRAVVKMILSLQETVRALGIDMEVEEVPFEQWIGTLLGHENLGLQVSGYAPDYPDPGNYPSVILNSQSAVANGFNTANFRNRRVDRLLEVQATSEDKQERADAIGEILRIAGEELPYAPIVFEDTGVVVSDRLEYDGLTGLYYFARLGEKVHNA